MTDVSAPAFTPGPWVAGTKGDTSTKRMYWVCNYGDWDIWAPTPSDALNEANAHLIAASPTMYEALALLMQAFEDGLMLRDYDGFSGNDLGGPGHAEVLAAATAALAKARGE